MKVAKLVALLGLLAMTAALANGFVNGSFTGDGSELLANPWGIVSLVDLYVGFILFSLWIVFREKSIVASVIWVVLMMVLGFFTASLYVFLALQASGGSWLNFFLGARKDFVLKKEA